MNNNTRRVMQFNVWWRQNRHQSKGFTWLSMQAKRIAYAYNLPPFSFDQVQTITKRYLNSDYKRLSRKDCWTLWKMCHPLKSHRIDRLKSTADYLMEAKSKPKADINTDKPKKETRTVEVVYKTRLTK